MVRADLYKSRTTSSGKIIPPFLLKEGEKKYGPDNPPPFTSGGGSRSRQSEVNQEEIARRQAELQAQEEARRQAEQERKKLEEQRRQEEIRRKQEETYGKKFVLRQEERERQQEFIKQQAVARGVDISTEVKKRGFLNKLRKEGKQPPRTLVSPQVYRELKERGEEGDTTAKEALSKSIVRTQTEGIFGLGSEVIYKEADTGKEYAKELKTLSASEEGRTSQQKANAVFANWRRTLSEGYAKINQPLSFLPTKESIFGEEGEITRSIYESQEKLPSWLRLSKTEQKIAASQVGGVKGVYGDIRNQPAKQVILFGAGLTTGSLFEGTAIAATYIPRGGPAVGAAIKGAAVGAGAGLTAQYIYGKADEIKRATSYETKGEIVGIGLKDIGLIGLGYARGKKLAKQVEGSLRTRGREYLEIPQGEYPSANPKKQLSLFRKNVIKELGDKPGAFHTTGEKFWKKEIIANPGTSELPGLYGSTQISTPFARISRSGYKPIPTSLTELFSVGGKPGVAYIKPLGFRYSPAGKGVLYSVSGQQFNYKFYNKPKLGYADVPGIKSEIEAIFRIKSGTYTFESGKYYTIIKDVRVPIDVFKYQGTPSPSPNPSPTPNVNVKTLDSKTISSYNLPNSYSIVTPQSTGLLGISSSKSKVSKSSYSSISKSSSSSLLSSRKSYSQPSSSFKITSISYPRYSSKASSKSLSRPYSSGSSSGSSSSSSGSSSSSLSFDSSSYNLIRYKPKQKIKTGGFLVSIRRFGKFKPIGRVRSQRKAFEIGRKRVSQSLGASFKIEGAGTKFKTPKGFYSKTEKGGRVFIEKPKYRLSTKSELGEIQTFKRRSPKKKARKRGKKKI